MIINNSIQQNKDINQVIRPLIQEKWLDVSNGDFVVSVNAYMVYSSLLSGMLGREEDLLVKHR